MIITNSIINMLVNIQNTYQSMYAFFYKKINQSSYTNNGLSTYAIDYELLLPSSELLESLNTNQVSAQMRAYVQLCEELVARIDTTIRIQQNIFYEQIKNVLDNSITQMSGFAESLLNAKYANQFSYTVPADMGFIQAMHLNGLDLSTYSQQIELNYTIVDFNNILKGTVLIFYRKTQ